jgi:4-diphosphocytidyl-2-C-methyl-D-erythritol kinase
MLYFPPAKINLGLYITGKRDDGYHDLLTGFYQIGLRDVLEVIPFGVDVFKTTGLPIPEGEKANLVLRARDLLRDNLGADRVPPLYIHLHKHIPMGAGLGGGSADASYALSGINDVFGLGLTAEDLRAFALKLGSDCPLFVSAAPQIGRGRGELLSPIELTLSGYEILLLMPDIHVSTSEAFAGVQPRPPEIDLAFILSQVPKAWRGQLHNQFEDTVFPKHPVLKEIKEGLYHAGALYAAMTGSGAAMFGIFENGTAALVDLTFFPAIRHSYCGTLT